MTSMIFYERATVLNRARHQNLKLNGNEQNFLFAARTNSVLLAGSEFAEAVRDYAIVFVGQEQGPFTAAALVGLGDQENLMVDAGGTWESETYVPAFIRRYPFVLAGADNAESLTVCIDEACGALNNEQGQALFGADGVETAYLKNIVGFLQLFHREMQRTGEFAARLAALGLLSSKVVNVQGNGSKQTLEGLWVVDKEKLKALADSQTLQLVRSGDMAWIYAHLLSLSNVSRLAHRLDVRRRAALEALPTDASGVAH
jgi:hypothetical protein